MTSRPTLYLLSGLPCSGKSTYARALEEQGVTRICVDEMMIESEGRLGTDYEASDHIARLAPIVSHALELVQLSLASGDDVVFDHGLGHRAERDQMKLIAENAGAGWKLLYFDAPLETLRARCQERHGRTDAVPIDPATFDFLASVFNPPAGEGESLQMT